MIVVYSAETALNAVDRSAVWLMRFRRRKLDKLKNMVEKFKQVCQDGSALPAGATGA